MSWSLNEPLLLLQICFELKKNKEISNFFLPHASSWCLRFTCNVDLRWSSAVGSWLQHLHWWWWASKTSSSQSVASDAAYRMNTSASVCIWLPNLLKNKSSDNGVSPISTQISACFQCLFSSYSQTLFTFLLSIRGGSFWQMKKGKWGAPSKGLGEPRADLGVRFPFLGHILYHSVFYLLTLS